jgi:GNAT superfamily N-acetyltransferase
MADSTRLLTLDECATAGEVLQRAFYHDPLQQWFFPDPDVRRTKCAPVFHNFAARGCLFGEVITTTNGVNGVAIWSPPGPREVTEETMAKAGIDRTPELMGEESYTRSIEFFAWLGQFHHRDAPVDHWYLEILGVDPPLQGQGIGTSLMMPILRRADEAGLPCYVETAQQRNVPLYTRAGFKVMEDVVEPKSGVRIWTFLRPVGG